MRFLSYVGIALLCQGVSAEEYPRVSADLAAYDAHVADAEAEFAKRPADPHEKGWVKMKLAHMVNIDQYMRKYSFTPADHGYSDAERQDFEARFASRWQQVDARNVAGLEELIGIHGWFTISSFGEEAANNAWLLAQHADQDRAFQRRVLGLLEPLVARHEVRPEHYAYLFDRLAVSLDDAGGRRPQRYGTQGQCVGKGEWQPYEAEDPAHLDQRRASVGLGSEADYRKQFVDLCR